MFFGSTLLFHGRKNNKEREGGGIMRNRAIAWLVVLAFLMVLTTLTGCAKNAYFGVRNKAIGVPDDFARTESAIEKAGKSPGAQYAPEKIAKAQELARKGIETYWGCRTTEAMALLAEARNLAKQAELAQAPPPKPAPAPVAVAPPKPKPAPAKPAPAKVAPAPKPVAVPPAPKKIIILRGVNFAFNSAKLTPQSQAFLDEHVGVLKKERNITVQIGGHTDDTGPEDYNKGLSERRAKSVMEYLISRGIPSENLRTVGYGESNPIASNITREGRAANRRVEFRIFE
jgi:outer membrane protein OmpA-like peptidoglycan-associated protein